MLILYTLVIYGRMRRCVRLHVCAFCNQDELERDTVRSPLWSSCLPKGAFAHDIECHVPNDVIDVNASSLPGSIQKLLNKHFGCFVHDCVVVLQAAFSKISLIPFRDIDGNNQIQNCLEAGAAVASPIGRLSMDVASRAIQFCIV